MAQISRPFQIAFVGVLALAAVWLFALHGHSSSSTGSSSSPVAPAATATSSSQGVGTGKPTTVYHGAAPGVEGLSSAIAKAQGAVATSQQNAKDLEAKSAAASGATAAPAAAAAPASTTAPSHSGAAAAAPTVTKVSSGTSTATVVTKAPAKKAASPTHVAAVVGAPANQRLVEADLKAGAVSVVLFWDPRGADDRLVQRQLWLLEGVHHRIGPLMHYTVVQRLLKVFGLELGKKIAVHRALASQVATFGTITRGVQVYSTPTILVIGKTGKTTTITGFTDAFGIEQAIDEARP
jgi:hypothetical protein